jgi:mRNA degradation ribonuclease J1/J2
LIEYKDDMIIVDAGMEFASGDATMGADYLIPDVNYVKKNLKKLR